MNERRYGWVVNVVYIRNAVILSFLKRERLGAGERGVVEKEQREIEIEKRKECFLCSRPVTPGVDSINGKARVKARFRCGS